MRANRITRLYALLVVAALWACAPHAAASAPVYSFDVAPGTLEAVLNRIAIQARVLLIVDPRTVDGIAASGVRGHRSIEDALRAVLDPAGLTNVGTLLLDRSRISVVGFGRSQVER